MKSTKIEKIRSITLQTLLTLWTLQSDWSFGCSNLLFDYFLNGLSVLPSLFNEHLIMRINIFSPHYFQSILNRLFTFINDFFKSPQDSYSFIELYWILQELQEFREFMNSTKSPKVSHEIQAKQWSKIKNLWNNIRLFCWQFFERLWKCIWILD